MLRPSHCNGLIDNTYISILNCHFSPISLQNGWISTFVLWCQMLASQIGCLKIFITFFPTRARIGWKIPHSGGRYAWAFYIYVSPPRSSAFFKTFTSFVKYFHGWGGAKGEVVFRNPSYTRFLLFLDPAQPARLFCEICIFENSVLPTAAARADINVNPGLIRPRTSINESNRAGDRFSGKIRSIDRSAPPRTPESKSWGWKLESGGGGVPHVDFEYRLLTKVLIGSAQQRKYLNRASKVAASKFLVLWVKNKWTACCFLPSYHELGCLTIPHQQLPEKSHL